MIGQVAIELVLENEVCGELGQSLDIVIDIFFASSETSL